MCFNYKINSKIIPSEENKPSIHWGIDFPHRWNNWIYDYEQIFPVQKMKFEKFEFNVPNDTDFMLKNIYGNYMTFPKSICPHHTDEMMFTKEELSEMKKLAQEVENA